MFFCYPSYICMRHVAIVTISFEMTMYMITTQENKEDALVVQGYFGDLHLICKSKLIPRDEERGKTNLSALANLDADKVRCRHLQHLLAIYYLECCSGMETEMFELLKKAGELGNTMSTLTLGYLYRAGIGTRKCYEKAFKLYMLDAMKGNPIAQCNIGISYEKGEGVRRNPDEALAWFLKSAEQRYAAGIYSVGVCYLFGRGTKINYTAAVETLRLAVDQGHVEAHNKLAWCYHCGLGVHKDNEVAANLCKFSAMMGNTAAAEFMGRAHEHGWGVKKSIVEAMRFYRQASSGDITLKFASDKVLSLKSRYIEEVTSD